MVKRKKRSDRLQPVSQRLLKEMAPPTLPPESQPLPEPEPEASGLDDSEMMDQKPQKGSKKRTLPPKAITADAHEEFGIKFKIYLTAELQAKIADYAETSRMSQKDVIRSCIKRANQLLRDLHEQNEISALQVPDPDISPLPKDQEVAGRIVIPEDLYDAIAAQFDPLKLHSKVRLMTITYVALFNHLFQIH